MRHLCRTVWWPGNAGTGFSQHGVPPSLTPPPTPHQSVCVRVCEIHPKRTIFLQLVVLHEITGLEHDMPKKSLIRNDYECFVVILWNF